VHKEVQVHVASYPQVPQSFQHTPDLFNTRVLKDLNTSVLKRSGHLGTRRLINNVVLDVKIMIANIDTTMSCVEI
jgi:hypothetical protein